MLGNRASARDDTARSTVPRGQALFGGSPSSSRRSIRLGESARVSWRLAFCIASLLLVLSVTLLLPRTRKGITGTLCPKWKSDVMAIECACKEYAQDHAGRYPASLSELVSPDAGGRSYVESGRLPLDPWRHEYGYAPPSAERPLPRIFTLGRDGKPGGEGDDADLDNFRLPRDE
jgi:general secretion pathway protein G